MHELLIKCILILRVFFEFDSETVNSFTEKAVDFCLDSFILASLDAVLLLDALQKVVWSEMFMKLVPDFWRPLGHLTFSAIRV